MRKNKTILKVASLDFEYAHELTLEDINLTVYEKDFLALIGPNGGGKSTLLKLLLGIYKPKKGSIDIVSTKLAYVPQDTNININFPIQAIDIVMMGDLKNKSKADALHVLEEVGMHKYAHTKIASLSGGERQRVMIARALFSKPELLLLDEPTSNIDPNGQKQIYELLKKLNEKITIVVVSHDISIVMQYANKVAHINKKLTFHDLSSMRKDFNTSAEHICEVELLEFMQEQKC